MHNLILKKIKEQALTGRGGACFPTHLKWEMVKNATGDKKFVICNASEGEPGILKDWHLLKYHPDRVVDGIKIAISFLEAEQGYIFINEKYYSQFKNILEKLIGGHKIELFKKPHLAGYIGGEESTLLNCIEGKRAEPRLRPPFPTTAGLWNYPTLINNVETLYDVSLINSGTYNKTRFYTINGDCLHHGVFEESEDITIRDLLSKTKNLPDFDFFVQIGGDGSGVVLNQNQINEKISGAGSVTVYSVLKHDPMDLIKKWVNFYLNESCGQCTPCREGVNRLNEILKSKNKNWGQFFDILETLENSSFCALGRSVSVPIKSLNKNILNNNLEKL